VQQHHQPHQHERPPSSEQATPDSAASFASLEPHLQSLLDKISLLQMEQEARLENQREACRLHPSHVSSPVEENLAMAKGKYKYNCLNYTYIGITKIWKYSFETGFGFGFCTYETQRLTTHLSLFGTRIYFNQPIFF
jgi:hypothetical protein